MKRHRYKPGDSAIIRARTAYLEEVARCMACGSVWRGLTVHEIARGADRGRAFRSRVAWLCVCWPCNLEMARPAIWPIPRQLALKALADPAYYDLADFNRLRRREECAITQAEVDGFLDTVFVTYPICEG